MGAPAIRVENLSKRYRLKASQGGARTLREVLTDAGREPFRRLFARNGHVRDGRSPATAAFWALKDVSFAVEPGEVIGIIGRNGAGKSTLLKILSRITEPTGGYADIAGRVGSLLEVGTGFHNELTGRENIFLNGAILGMKRQEVARKFDAIVEFAEIAGFLDTPVKRYSSGMYMRLAFAVAAHLEPDILIVDEVLAVGDAAFQSKCMGQMQSAARGGRTILFVSHNMQAIQGLCQRVLRIHHGKIVEEGDPATVISHYLSSGLGDLPEKTWGTAAAPGTDELRLLAVRVRPREGPVASVYSTNQDLFVELDFTSRDGQPEGLCIGFDLLTPEGTTVLRSYQTDGPQDNWPRIERGTNRCCCLLPAGLLNGGVYHVCPRIGLHNLRWMVHLDSVVQFSTVLNHGQSPLWYSLRQGKRPGVVSPILTWFSGEPIP